MKPDTCKGCPLYEKPGPVWGSGSQNATLIILGQNPGETEIQEGRPFCGASGRILDRALGDAGVSRTQNYVTNVVKCFVPPGSPVPPGAVTKCKPLLDRELAHLARATTILTLGAEAFNELCRPKRFHILHDRRVSRTDPAYWLRGCPYRLERMGQTYNVIPTLHPAFVARTGFMASPDMEADIQKAGRFSSGLVQWSEASYDYNPSHAQVEEYIELILHNAKGGLDIETPESAEDEDELAEGRFLPVGLIGLSAQAGHALGVQPDQFELLQPLFDRARRCGRYDVWQGVRPRLWAYNAGFDFHHLSRIFALDGVQPADAMMVFHELRPELKKKDLATCLSFFTNRPFHKNLQDTEPDRYNAYDTFGVLEAGEQMLIELDNLGAMQSMRFPWARQTPAQLFWRHMMPIIPEIGTWNWIGTPYDQEKSDRMEVQLRMILAKYEQWWATNIPHFQWSSPKQLVQMFEALGVKVPKVKRTRTKDTKNGAKGSIYYSPSVDDEFLESLAKTGNQTATLIITMRELRKAGDFLNIASADGRVYSRAKPHGQVGGRIQTVNFNWQQVPEELAGTSPRDCVPPENRDTDLIISADFSQIEFWAYCWYSQCKRGLELKASGDYIYGGFYEDIWKEPFFLPNMPRKKQYRDESRTPAWKLLVAKSWPLGFTYGRGRPNPQSQGLPINDRDAQRIFDGFHRDYPEFRVLHNNLMLKATKYRYLQTVFGRIRRFPNAEKQYNEICAFPGQTTAVDVLLRNVLVPLPSLLRERFGERSRIYFTVHDSAVMNVNCAGPDGRFSMQRAEDAYWFVKQCFETPIDEMDGFVFPAEVKIGPSWGRGVSIEKLAGALNDKSTGAV